MHLGIKKSPLDPFSCIDDDSYLETLSYWLELGSSVTWNSLSDVLDHFETKHTVDELTDKIVSVLGGGHQVRVWVMCIQYSIHRRHICVPSQSPSHPAGPPPGLQTQL